MDNNLKRVKAKSVMGFMFMPQFRTMMPAFSHLRPVFIRTMGVMFEQSGLLPKNHPSTRYGDAGAEKYTTKQLLQDAWYNLRTQKGMTFYQYGLFGSVVMMIILTIAAFITAVSAFVGGFATVAKAQLFDHPSGPTDLSTLTVAPAGLFDDRLPGAVGGPPDLAIDILNKTLRQAATNTGGPLQNALGDLLEVYSTGVMIIASIIVFWAVLSIVIDTARSGQFGGQRHNMVWTPIRFVFAMGLMIPFGNGFNAGQIIVLKLAEWGSNFATNGWVAYVTSVANGSLVVQTSPTDPTELAVALARNFACAASANSYIGRLNNTTDLSTMDEAVRLYTGTGLVPVPGPADLGAPNTVVNVSEGSSKSHLEFYFGNKQSFTFCGGMSIPQGSGADLNNIIANAGLGAGQSRPGEVLVARIRQELRDAHLAGMASMDGEARGIGCAFANKTIPDFSVAANIIQTMPEAGAASPGFGVAIIIGCTGRINTCTNAGVVKSFDDQGMIDNLCLQTMIENYSAAVDGVITGAVNTLLTDYVSDPSTTAGSLLAEVEALGWAGMGMWYHRISSLNTGVLSAAEGGITIVPPTFSKIVSGEMRNQINTTLTVYDNWWKNIDSPMLPAVVANGLSSSGISTKKTAAEKDIQGIFEAGGDGRTKSDAVIGLVFPSDGFFVSDLSKYSDGTYPLAALSSIASTMWMWIAVGLFGTAMVMALIAGLSFSVESGGLLGVTVGKAGGTFSLGDVILSVLNGPVGVLINSLSGILIMVTLVLMYLVPMLPWLRVTFGVLSWIMTVFEAVVMIPVVALAHLRTDGEGLMGPLTQTAYGLWLNLLLRPILMVLGYVAALLVFNTMVQYVNNTIAGAAWGTGLSSLDAVGRVVYSIMYVAIIYVMANSVFKLIDIFPNATMKWLGTGGTDNSFDDSAVEGMIVAGARSGGDFGSGMVSGGKESLGRGKDKRAAAAAPKKGPGGMDTSKLGKN